MAKASPTGMVKKALADRRRRVISRNPSIPPPRIVGRPTRELYDFGPEINARMQDPPVQTLGGTEQIPQTGDVQMGQSPHQGLYQAGRQMGQNMVSGPEQGVVEPPYTSAGPDEQRMGIAGGAQPKSNIQVLEDRVAQIMAQRDAARSRPLETDDSKLVNAYQGMKHATQAALRMNQDPMFAIGAAIGGSLRGLFVPKEYEQFKIGRDVAKADAELDITNKQIDDQIGQDFKKAQMENWEETQRRQLLELERKTAADAERVKYWQGLLEDKAAGRKLQGMQVEDLKGYRQHLIANGTRMTDARIKQIDAAIEDRDLDRESRERIAGQRTGAAAANTTIRSVTDAARTINSIRQMGEDNGKTPTEIEQRIKLFKNELPESIRNQLQ